MAVDAMIVSAAICGSDNREDAIAGTHDVWSRLGRKHRVTAWCGTSLADRERAQTTPIMAQGCNSAKTGAPKILHRHLLKTWSCPATARDYGLFWKGHGTGLTLEVVAPGLTGAWT
jgi:hypothetical protein